MTHTIWHTLQQYDYNMMTIQLGNGVVLELEANRDKSVSISFEVKGTKSRGKHTLPVSAFKQAKRIWRRILNSPQGKVVWKCGASDKSHEAALRKQEWYIKSFGFQVEGEVYEGFVQTLVLDNR